jgi:glycosyltransferase involved in cell wall biosynthesis
MTHDRSPQPVAYLLKMFPRFSETFILAEILELERQGQPVRIFSLKLPADAHRHADVDRVRAPITYVPALARSSAVTYAKAHGTLAMRHPVRYAKAAWQVARRRSRGACKRFLQAGLIGSHLEEAGIAHVHAHFASSATSVAHFIEAMTGIGYSFTAHAKDIYIDGVNPDVLRRKIDRARFVVTVSDYNVDYLRSIAPEGRITRIYNGLDLSRFRANGTTPDELPLILAVGRLVEKKGFLDVVDALSLLHARGIPFRAKIVGTGDLAPTLRARIADLGLAGLVDLPGPMPREDLIGLYPRASMVVAPCLVADDGNRDGLPTVLIEAMALEVPVISTAVTGIPELVRHGETGTIVPQKDPVTLADAMARILADPAGARQMARSGRSLIEHSFDLSRNVADLRARFASREVVA